MITKISQVSEMLAGPADPEQIMSRRRRRYEVLKGMLREYEGHQALSSNLSTVRKTK